VSNPYKEMLSKNADLALGKLAPKKYTVALLNLYPFVTLISF
jgi:hypothetical protein